MGDQGDHIPRAVFDQRIRRLGQRATRVGHVVDEDGGLAHDVADQRHARHLVRALAFLVDEREGEVQSVGHAGCALGTAGVGADDHAFVLVGVVAAVFCCCSSSRSSSSASSFTGVDEVLADPFHRRGLGVEVVDRDVEEALDLGGVEVHGDDVVAAGGLEHVGHEFGGDGGA